MPATKGLTAYSTTSGPKCRPKNAATVSPGTGGAGRRASSPSSRSLVRRPKNPLLSKAGGEPGSTRSCPPRSTNRCWLTGAASWMASAKPSSVSSSSSSALSSSELGPASSW